jgi:hypothetical protein
VVAQSTEIQNTLGTNIHQKEKTTMRQTSRALITHRQGVRWWKQYFLKGKNHPIHINFF